MKAEEQKWLIEKLGGRCCGIEEDNPWVPACSICPCGKQHVQPLGTPNGYEWVRQRMCELELWDELYFWLRGQEPLVFRTQHERIAGCAFHEKDSAEKAKLIHDFLSDFLRERE